MSFCGKCGGRVPAEWKFCRKCGTPAKAGDRPLPAVKPQPPPPNAPAGGRTRSFFASSVGIATVVFLALLVSGAVVAGVILAAGGDGSSSAQITGAIADYMVCMKECGELVEDTPFAEDLNRSAAPAQIADLRDGLRGNARKAREILRKSKLIAAEGNWGEARGHLVSSLENYEACVMTMDDFWGKAETAMVRSGATSCLDEAVVSQASQSVLDVLRNEGVDVDEDLKEMTDTASECESELESAEEEVEKAGGQDELEAQCERQDVKYPLDPAIAAFLGAPPVLAEQVGAPVATSDTGAEEDENPPSSDEEATSLQALETFLSVWQSGYQPGQVLYDKGTPERAGRSGWRPVLEQLMTERMKGSGESNFVGTTWAGEGYVWADSHIKEAEVTDTGDSACYTVVWSFGAAGCNQIERRIVLKKVGNTWLVDSV